MGIPDAIAEEIAVQRDRLFVWAPTAFGAGIAVYFGLKFEPSLWVGAALSSFFLPLVFFAHKRHHDNLQWFFGYVAIVALMIASFGFFAAQIGTLNYGTPILAKSIGPVDVTGRIVSVEDLGGKSGSRIVLDNLTIESVVAEKTPKKIRIRFRKSEGLVAGARISTLAKIDPPSRAVAPGAYDFRRHLFFDGIGGVGFSYRAAKIINTADTDSTLLFESLRETINAKIKSQSGDVAGGIMTALITGERGSIADEDDDAMRDSGLYHLLSISGTHVTMVAGVLFFFSRFLMATVPFITLRYPIKKIAAGIALIGAGFYVFLAGAEVPAQRALLMTALIMIAIMMDRSPFSLRLIAFAALVVLAIAPHALVGVSFQMSFSAVAALICFFEYIRPWWMGWYSRAEFVRKSLMYLIAVCMTSMIAGTITGLFSLYHFQSFAVYGVLSNMMAVPLTGVVIMPAAVLALFLMPFGLEWVALDIMEWGTIWMLAIAHWTGGLDGAVVHVAQWPEITFACICVGVICFLLWEGWCGKAVACCILFTGLLTVSFSKQPDMIISETGKLMAVRGENDFLYLSSGRRERFVAENWQRLSGHAEEKARLFNDEQSPAKCDDAGCRVEIKGHAVSIVYNPRSFAEDCAWADVILSEAPLKKWHCDRGGVLLDLYDFKDDGAHSIYLGHKDVSVRSVGGESGTRPWTIQRK